MKTIAATLLLAMSSSAFAWATSPPWNTQQPTYGSGTNMSTFGANGIQTTQGTFAGQGVNLTTFGSQGFQTTTGTVGGQSVNCTTFGSGAFRNTTCN